MASNLVQPLVSILVNGVHRFSTCITIIRTDGVTFRFTDHNRELVVGGETFSPVHGMSLTARNSSEGTDPPNISSRGVISDDSITSDDLFAGKFRGAEVIEQIVDWRYPWAGVFKTYIYYIKQTVANDEVWNAELEGLLTRLRPKVGGVYTKNCRWELGDAKCGVDLPALSVSGTVDTITEDRRHFTTTLFGAADDYYNYGHLTWLSGNNVGLISEVKFYQEVNGDIELLVTTPFEIQSTDTFDIVPGCNKLFTGDCELKFNNKNRFGGFPYLPGNDAILRTPDAKT